jgi:hypothetical protein
VGVGKLGEQEQPIPSMVSPNATCSESEGQDSVTKRFQFGSESPPRPGSIAADERRIFPDHNARAKNINSADELTAKALLAGFTSGAVGLAWVASTDDINPPIFGGMRRKGSHVVPASDVGPVLGEHSLTERVDFDLPSA